MKRAEAVPRSKWLAIGGFVSHGLRAAAIVIGGSLLLVLTLLLWGVAQLILTFFFWAVLLVALAAVAGVGAFGAVRAASRRGKAGVRVPVPQEIPRQIAAARPISREPVFEEPALATIDIFRELSKEQLVSVALRGRVEEFREGDVLGVEGSRGERVYIILGGQMQLQTASPMGELTVRIAGAGESWPLAALIGEGSLITSAVALSDLRTVIIPRDSLLELLNARPDIGRKVYKAIAEILAGRYRSSLKRMTEAMDRALQHAEIWANV
jgi:hypothetical protein